MMQRIGAPNKVPRKVGLAGQPTGSPASPWFCLLVLLMLGGLASDGHAHNRSAEKLPSPPVRLRVIAPSAIGPWLMRIDNEGDQPVRIAADVRLLRLEVWAVAGDAPAYRTDHGYLRRSVTCDGPKDFGLTRHFPVDRELMLEPGHSYVEEFDPRLLCFGSKAKLLTPAARVKVSYGWPEQPRRRGKMQSAPFVADAAAAPRKFKPLRQLVSPRFVLSHAPAMEYGSRRDGHRQKGDPHATQGQPPAQGPPPAGSAEMGAAKPHPPPDSDARHPSAEKASHFHPRRTAPRRRPKPRDELSGRLTLTTNHFASGGRAAGLQLSVQAHNSGERPLFVALRSRQLSFKVKGPDGLVKCARPSSGHSVPRELFRQLHHGKHVHMNVMIAEACPPQTFARPGLYRVVPTLHADADGSEYGLSALTGRVTIKMPGPVGGTHRLQDDATLVRIQRGNKRFHRHPPQQIPTRIMDQR